MSDSQEVKIARLEVQVGNVEKKLGTIDTKLDDISKSIELHHEKVESNYATVVQLTEVKRGIRGNMIMSNLVTSGITALFIFLLTFYLTNR